MLVGGSHWDQVRHPNLIFLLRFTPELPLTFVKSRLDVQSYERYDHPYLSWGFDHRFLARRSQSKDGMLS
jgi:hypothetical protein